MKKYSDFTIEEKAEILDRFQRSIKENCVDLWHITQFITKHKGDHVTENMIGALWVTLNGSLYVIEAIYNDDFYNNLSKTEPFASSREVHARLLI